MVRMTGLVETLVQNRSQPPLLTDVKQTDVLLEWHKADGEDATVVLEAVGIIAMAQDKDSGSNPAHESYNSRHWRIVLAQRPTARSG